MGGPAHEQAHGPMQGQAHEPLATYRLQLTPEFGFAQVAKVLEYLARLGMSDIYASPVFKAVPGSQHGYDVTDPTGINPELGDPRELEALMRKARGLGLAWIQDIVPNHMAFDKANSMLMDVLESGPNSAFYRTFDIDWQHAYEPLRGRLLAPFLGRMYGEALEAGEIGLHYRDGGFQVTYYNHEFPLAIETYADVLEPVLHRLGRSAGKESHDYVKLLGLLYVLRTLSSIEELAERRDQVRFVKELLAELYDNDEALHRLVKEEMGRINGRPGQSASFDRLDALLRRQHFRLAYWKVAAAEINYRRFFNINGLISVCVEDQDVFTFTHGLIADMLRHGMIQGLRVDHVDGLLDPEGYLRRLRHLAGKAYLVVEKILQFGEPLPKSWPVAGTTGYDFMNMAGGVLCATENRRRFERIYRRFSDTRQAYQDLVALKKRLIIGKEMGGDVENLARLMKSVAGGLRHGSDITMFALKWAIVEVLARFPVYRTYVSPTSFTDLDGAYIREATGRARKHLPSHRYELDFVEDFLLLRHYDKLSDEERQGWMEVAMRFQQLTGPLMAKGFEDTLLYSYNRLISLNEVGGSPERFGVSLDEFHAFCRQRAARWPLTMNSLGSHDAKRGEDARARIMVLSEIPEEFDARLKAWTRMNRQAKTSWQGERYPGGNDEYFLYQTLLGSYPVEDRAAEGYLERLKGFLLKAAREAKARTSWTEPDARYEQALLDFAQAILEPSKANRFLPDFREFLQRVAFHGIFNSLTQTLLKITAPGVPDFYQGSELLDFAFVDPDNRRPVDFQDRALALERIASRAERDAEGLAAELLGSMHDGRVKLFLVLRALAARKTHAGLFRHGAYIPLKVQGPHTRRVIAFARRHHEHGWAVVAAPRLLTGLTQPGSLPLEDVWVDTKLTLPLDAPTAWREAISGRPVESTGGLELAEAWQAFPGALLVPA